jgi:hypothetical protein
MTNNEIMAFFNLSASQFDNLKTDLKKDMQACNDYFELHHIGYSIDYETNIKTIDYDYLTF